MQKFTINDFDKMFPTEDSCLEWLKNYLYPDGIFCDKCERITKHHKIAGRRSYSCDYCGHHVHPTAGTIYHKSSTPLRTWFYAVFKMASTRCGISAKQIQRETGVTYKTAWRMFKQIRSMLNEDLEPLSGKVEVDETYCGGKRRGKRGRGAEGKTIVAGAVERKGRVIAKVGSDVSSNTLVPFVTEKVLPKSMVFTDELPSYNPLSSQGYTHRRIRHASKVYVSGDVHTNTIEGFWSLVKGGIGGVYHQVGAQYLQSYFDEYAFRYNRRNDDMPMFWSVMTQVQKSCD
jgi:transposase